MYIFILLIAFIIFIALISQIIDNKKLIDCKTCGKKISKNAKCCPHCGAKPTGQIIGEAISGIGCGLLIAPIFIAIIIIYAVFMFSLKQI